MKRLSTSAVRCALVGAVACGVLFAVIAIADVGPDDEIPGVPFPPSPINGSLTTTTNPNALDVNDVYAVKLGFNDRLDVALSTPPNADYALYLIAPGTQRVVDALAPPYSRLLRYSDEATGKAEAITYVCDRSTAATCYVDAKAWTGSGPYAMTWQMEHLRAPSVTSTAPAIAPYGGGVTISSTVTLDDWRLRNLPATVICNPYGAPSWTAVAEATSTATGTLRVVVRPAKQTRYRLKTRWATGPLGISIGWGYGPIVTITPRAYLTVTGAPESIGPGRVFKVSGSHKPSHSTVATGHVVVGAWKRTPSKTWKYYRSFSARNSGSGWYASVALPTKGAWLIRATVPADTSHAGTQSLSRWVTVK